MNKFLIPYSNRTSVNSVYTKRFNKDTYVLFYETQGDITPALRHFYYYLLDEVYNGKPIL